MPGSNAANIIKRQLLVRDFQRAYNDVELIDVQPPANWYIIPSDEDRKQLWDHEIAGVFDFGEQYRLFVHLRAYWHNQFPDDRALTTVLNPNIWIGKRLRANKIIYRCNHFPGLGAKLTTLVKMKLPTRGTNKSAIFFGELVLFFTHSFEGKGIYKKGKIQK